MKKRLVSGLLAVGAMTTMLTGCGNSSDKYPEYDTYSRDQIIESYLGIKQQAEALQEQYNNISSLYESYKVENTPSSAIGMTGDGTNRLTFNSVDSKIIFPNTFQYPGSTPATANGSINIIDDVTITPGTNWIAKISATTIELEHTSGISATIKAAKEEMLYDGSAIETNVLSKWFEGMPDPRVTYTHIDVGGEDRGCQAVTPTRIDSEDAQLRCGMIGSGGGTCLVYIFVYRGSQDPIKDELVTSLLNTLKLNGESVVIQQ